MQACPWRNMSQKAVTCCLMDFFNCHIYCLPSSCGFAARRFSFYQNLDCFQFAQKESFGHFMSGLKCLFLYFDGSSAKVLQNCDVLIRGGGAGGGGELPLEWLYCGMSCDNKSQHDDMKRFVGFTPSEYDVILLNEIKAAGGGLTLQQRVGDMDCLKRRRTRLHFHDPDM